MAAGYYLTALVFHDQSKELAQYIGPYLDRLSLEGLADIPFHGVDLIHGHGDYEGISPEKRKRHLIAFSMFVRTLPITYRVFSYERAYTEDRDRLEARLRKDIIDFVFDRLDDFQLYDRVAIYYDGGQEAVTASLHGRSITPLRAVPRSTNRFPTRKRGWPRRRTTCARSASPRDATSAET